VATTAVCCLWRASDDVGGIVNSRAIAAGTVALLLLLVGGCGAGMATYRGHLAPTPAQIAKTLHDHLHFFDGKKVVATGVVEKVARKGESPPAIPMLSVQPSPYDANYVFVTVGKSSSGVPVRVTAQDPPNVEFQVGEEVTVWGTGKSAFASNVYDNVTLTDAVVDRGEVRLPWMSPGGVSVANASSSPTATSTPTPALGPSISEAMSYLIKARVHADNALKSVRDPTSFANQFTEGVQDWKMASKFIPHNANSRKSQLVRYFALYLGRTFMSEQSVAKAVLNHNKAAVSRFTRQAADSSLVADAFLNAYNKYMSTSPLVTAAAKDLVRAWMLENSSLRTSDATSAQKRLHKGMRDYNAAITLMNRENNNSYQYQLAVAFGHCVNNVGVDESAMFKAVTNGNKATAMRFAKRAVLWVKKSDLALHAYFTGLKLTKG
jgi:hypothetical protein